MEFKNNQFLVNNKKRIFIVIFFFLLLVLATGIFWILRTNVSHNKSKYIISGVPYYGIWNQKGNASYAGDGDTTAAISSILDYWSPGENNYTIYSKFIRDRVSEYRFVSGETIYEIIDAFYRDKYIFKREVLSINELGKYLNSDVKTPLITFYAVSENDPKQVYHPAAVIIGVDYSEEKIIMHHYWLGNNYKVSFSDFKKSQESMIEGEKDEYFIIQPKNIKEKVNEINERNMQPYPDRNELMEASKEMVQKYAIGYGLARVTRSDDESVKYLLKVKNDPKLEENLPPYFKVRLYFLLAQTHMRTNQLEAAKDFASKSIEINYNLDKPFKDWPGIDIVKNKPDRIGELSDPYTVLGDIYRRLGDLKKAEENYLKALAIYPNSGETKRGMDLLRAELIKNVEHK